MTRKLAALLTVVGVVVVGGVNYLLTRPDPGVSRADLLDAGISELCTTQAATWAVRDLCQNVRADGGLSPRYRQLKDVAYQCPPLLERVRLADGGVGLDAGDNPPVLVPRWLTRPALRGCFEVVGRGARFLGASFDDGGASVEIDTDECTCRARGKLCRITDGGILNFERTYDSVAGPFVGAGCTPTPCVVLDGEQDLGLADDCR